MVWGNGEIIKENKLILNERILDGVNKMRDIVKIKEKVKIVLK